MDFKWQNTSFTVKEKVSAYIHHITLQCQNLADTKINDQIFSYFETTYIHFWQTCTGFLNFCIDFFTFVCHVYSSPPSSKGHLY